MRPVGWVTCRRLPEPDPDQQPALAALAAAGLAVQPLAWDDPAADPSSFAACVLRSCWNYHLAPDAFVRWVEAAAARTVLLNGAAAVRWNLHKRYLRALQQRGVAVAPTAWLSRGDRVDLADLARQRGWREVVIKPAVSASSFATERHVPGQAAAQAFLDQSLRQRDVLVQELLPGVEGSGERCTVWIDGAPTHAVVKRPRWAGDDEAVSPAGAVGRAEAALAEAAIAAACADGGFAVDQLLYARIDTVEHHGRPVVAELELIEPSLYFAASAAALSRFVAAVQRRLRSR